MSDQEVGALRQRFSAILKGLIWFYLVLVLLIMTASVLYPDIEIRGIILSVGTVALFLSIPLLIIALALRAPRLILGCLVAVAGWSLFHAHYLIPRHTASDIAPDFTVLTYNLQMTTEDLEVLATILEQTDADIVALQELSVLAGAHFKTRLSTRYPYIAFYPRNPGNTGMGVMSRYPITDEEFWQNEQIDGALGNMRVEIDVDGTLIALYNVHPRPPISFESGLTPAAHSAEVDVLMARLADEPLPTLIAGDLNMSPWLDEYPQITGAGFRDSFYDVGHAGFGFTFPAGKAGLPNMPMLRLDYLFHDASFTALESYVWSQSGPSDHLPVWTSLIFTGP